MRDLSISKRFYAGRSAAWPTTRVLIYPFFFVAVYLTWACYMAMGDHWHLLSDFWQMPLTMAFGSMVAGSTPTGGGAVAFPVCTKLLAMPPSQASTFGLMIQSIGMTSAALFIWYRRIPVLWNVVLYASIGGLIGLVISVLFVQMPESYPRLLFTTTVTLFGVALIYSRFFMCRSGNARIARFGPLQRAEFLLLGLIGGLISDATGSGVDIVVFMTLALSYQLVDRVSIPTTVVCMAINSLVGFTLHATVVQDVGTVWNYWLASVPIVAIGAPLGTFLMTRCSSNVIFSLILFLITADLISTITVVHFDFQMLEVAGNLALICMLIFALMIYRGQRVLIDAA